LDKVFERHLITHNVTTCCNSTHKYITAKEERKRSQ